ncbi:hypothetical protein XELAEV_18003071mg [Xenopus laevis]|nr:hypothetical protein XELAEV_18003071mg [Xenopus laevis]
MFPIVIALYLWGEVLMNKRVIFVSDNVGVVQAINRQSASSGEVVRLLRILILRCLHLNVGFRAVHLPGVQNEIADSLSRFQWERFRQLAPLADKRGHRFPEHLWRLGTIGLEGGCHRIWIVEHSFVSWAEKRATVRRGGVQLGFPEHQVTVKWFGYPGLQWPGLFDGLMEAAAGEEHSHVLVVHAGGNDMGVMSQKNLVRLMKLDVDKIRSWFSGVVVVWSEMVPRLVWRWARDHSAMERSRIKLNKLLSAFVRRSGGVVIWHKDLEKALPGYYRRDGFHLSEIGLDIFNLDLARGVERALREYIYIPRKRGEAKEGGCPIAAKHTGVLATRYYKKAIYSNDLRKTNESSGAP